MKIGDILLKRGTAIGALIIRELTDEGASFSSSYSHCGIYAGAGKVYDAREPDIDLRTLDYEDYDVYRVGLTDEPTARLIAYCESQRGVRYATRALIEEGVERLFHIPLDIDLKGEEWCATFVCHAFAAIGLPLTRKELPTPNDIAWSIVPQKVAKGG